jgi:hypothetical protein
VKRPAGYHRRADQQPEYAGGEVTLGHPEDLTSVTSAAAAVVAERTGSSGHQGVRRRAAKAAINELRSLLTMRWRDGR